MHGGFLHVANTEVQILQAPSLRPCSVRLKLATLLYSNKGEDRASDAGVMMGDYTDGHARSEKTDEWMPAAA